MADSDRFGRQFADRRCRCQEFMLWAQQATSREMRVRTLSVCRS